MSEPGGPGLALVLAPGRRCAALALGSPCVTGKAVPAPLIGCLASMTNSQLGQPRHSGFVDQQAVHSLGDPLFEPGVAELEEVEV